jgi:hypothetical protein
MMIAKVDKVTLWTARATFALVTIILWFLLARCGLTFVWDSLKNMPYLGLCLIGYLAAGWVSFTGHKPSFVRGDPTTDSEGYRRIATMLAIFGISAIAITVWLWIALKR